MIKLNLGSGGDYIDGYTNVDLYAERADERYDIAKLPYTENSVDEIRGFHVIEHFDYMFAHEVMKEWHRVLKIGGRLHLETPDLLSSCKAMVDTDDDGRWGLYGHMFSEPWIPGLTHKFLYTEFQLRKLLNWAGFHTISRLPPSSKYVWKPHPPELFLNLEAIKS